MSRHVFFYDDGDLAARHNLHLTPGPVTKLGPVAMEHRSCDITYSACFLGSVVPMPDGGYRLYYSAVGRGEGRMYRLAYAESADGMTWTKPDLGQMQWEGEDTNWIWPEGQPEVGNIIQPQVMLLPDGSWRMWYWWHGHEIRRCPYVAAESDDGITWRGIDLDMPLIRHPFDRELGNQRWVAGLVNADPDDTFDFERTMDYVAAKRLRSNDAIFTYYNERAGRFEMYHVWLLPVDEGTCRVTPHDNAPGVIRVMARRESPDGIEWSDPEMIMFPDEHDPLQQQFYHLAVQPDGEWNIGLLGNYRCWEQTMDLELCFSRDTRRWIRPLRGGWIPRGGVDEHDYMAIYPTNRLLDRGDSWLVLYDGHNSKHNHQLPEGVTEYKDKIMAAEVPKGRFAGLQATERMVGAMTLRPFNLSVAQICVDANITGRLQAELRDPYGRPLPGYELNNCIPITGDDAKHILTWEGGRTTEAYQYDVVALRIEIEDGTIYSIDT